jgi:hypothetical protein
VIGVPTIENTNGAHGASERALTMRAWENLDAKRQPWPVLASALLFPILLLHTLPQTLAGLAVTVYRWLQGHRPVLYRFGPFLFIVVRARGPGPRGISLGVVIFSETPDILKHEFCHLFTGLWLSWAYLPVYGLEYLIFGHDRSPHERITVKLERDIDWAWRAIGGS